MRVPDGGTGEFESLLSNSFGEPGVSAQAEGLPSPQAVFSMEESRVKTSSGVPVYQGEKPLDIPELPGLSYNPVRGVKEESGIRTSSNASGFNEESGFRTSSGILESNEEPSVGTSSKSTGYQDAQSPGTKELISAQGMGSEKKSGFRTSSSGFDASEGSGFRASLSGLSKEGKDPGMGLFLPPVTPREQESSVEALREIKRVSTNLATRRQEMCAWVSQRPSSLFKGDGRTGVTVQESQGSSEEGVKIPRQEETKQQKGLQSSQRNVSATSRVKLLRLPQASHVRSSVCQTNIQAARYGAGFVPWRMGLGVRQDILTPTVLQGLVEQSDMGQDPVRGSAPTPSRTVFRGQVLLPQDRGPALGLPQRIENRVPELRQPTVRVVPRRVKD